MVNYRLIQGECAALRVVLRVIVTGLGGSRPMRYVEVETQGESKSAIVNCSQVAYLAESIYGTAIHFTSGEYLICVGELRAIAERLFGAGSEEMLLLQSRPSEEPALRLR
jgi:hypothetical protein